MLDRIAYEHGADLRREAAAYRRVANGSAGRAASRKDRAAPRLARRAGDGIRGAFHRRPAGVGCEA